MTREDTADSARHVFMRRLALALLVGQTVGAILILRLGFVWNEDRQYIKSTAVVCSEIVKLIGSVFLLHREVKSWRVVAAKIRTEIVQLPLETLKVAVPAFLYTIQNNLLLISLNNISGALYQVTYQLKILTTAVLSVAVLGRKVSPERWASLFVLTAGAAFINLGPNEAVGGSKALFRGLAAVLAACWTSGFAGIYLEKTLKESKTSIWIRNIQLAVYGSGLALLYCLIYDNAEIAVHGFFSGYTPIVIAGVLMQSLGGLVVAMVLKYADNLLKCFANAVAIVLSCFLSYAFLNDFQPSSYFAVGTTMVLGSTVVYSIGLETIGQSIGFNFTPPKEATAKQDSGEQKALEEGVSQSDAPTEIEAGGDETKAE